MNGPMRWVIACVAGLGLLIMTIAALAVAGIAFRSTFDSVSRSPELGPQIVIGLDLSEGNPLVTDPTFAGQAARRIASVIEDLPVRSRVTLRGFGDYGITPGRLTLDRVITPRRDAQAVAEFVETIIAGLPRIIAQGTFAVHKRSNIIAFLETMAQAVDCQTRPVSFHLVTDGLEDSEYVVLGGENITLPDPQTDLFPACRELTMLGVGVGQESPLVTRDLKTAWEAWATRAGFERFIGLDQW